jgi:hypothetical protein
MTKFLLLQNYEGGSGCTEPITDWAPQDIQAHIDFQVALNKELADQGELVAGYRMVDVESEARAIEIAAKASAAPGPGGVPIQQPIEVRQVMGVPSNDL